VDRDYQAQIFLFRTSDMQILSAKEGHQGMVTSMAFSPIGNILASSGLDLFVKFWDMSSSRLLGQVQIANPPGSLAFSPDGAKLAVATNLEVIFIDVPTMQREQSLQEASGTHLVYSPDGDHIYVQSVGSIKVIDPAANRVMLRFPDPFALVPTLSVAADGTVTGVSYETPEAVDGFALSPDGTQITSYTLDRALDSPQGIDSVRLAIWEANAGKYVTGIDFPGTLIHGIEYSPDGNVLAIGNGSEVWLWDTATWELHDRLHGHVGSIVDLAFTSEGDKLISAGSDGTIRVWSLKE
jgi:WD40 repeat protein